MLAKLPDDVQELVLAAIADPKQPQFALKKLQPARRLQKNSWAIRVTSQDWRAIAQKVGPVFTWYWVGNHAAYNHMVGTK